MARAAIVGLRAGRSSLAGLRLRRLWTREEIALLEAEMAEAPEEWDEQDQADMRTLRLHLKRLNARISHKQRLRDKGVREPGWTAKIVL